VFCVAANTGAQTRLYAGLEADFLTSPENSKKILNTGYGFNAGLGFLVSPSVELLFRVHYCHFGLDGDEYLEILDDWENIIIVPPLSEIDVDGGAVQAYGVIFDAKYVVTPPASESKGRFYIFGGAGIMHSEAMDKVTLSAEGYQDFPIEDDEGGSTDFMMNAGTGVDVDLTPKTAFFIEGGYSVVFDGDSDAPPGFEGNAAYISLTAGLNFAVGQ